MKTKYVVTAALVLALSGCTAEEMAALGVGDTSGQTCGFDQLVKNGPSYAGRLSHYQITLAVDNYVMIAIYDDGNVSYYNHEPPSSPTGVDATGNSITVDLVNCTMGIYDNGAYRYLLSSPVFTGGVLTSVDVIENPLSPTISATSAGVYLDFTVP